VLEYWKTERIRASAGDKPREAGTQEVSGNLGWVVGLSRAPDLEQEDGDDH